MAVPLGTRSLKEVWSWNFDAEFDELLTAVASCQAHGVVLALDTEFPGFLCEEPPFAVQAVRYWALRENVDLLRPIQLGFAVSSCSGVLCGAWTFNLWFDLATNLHTEESVRFLTAAGVDFPRHAVEGIDPAALAWRLAASPLVGCHVSSPQWVTFSGCYDWGYLLKLLTDRPMPLDAASFEALLDSLCPCRHDLRESLPRGSLDSLLMAYSVDRFGAAHTAGSDALATLELFLRMALPRESVAMEDPSYQGEETDYQGTYLKKSVPEGSLVPLASSGSKEDNDGARSRESRRSSSKGVSSAGEKEESLAALVERKSKLEDICLSVSLSVRALQSTDLHYLSLGLSTFSVLVFSWLYLLF
mmetsp:Transcript_127439/g.284983  ORF Transcript_127439/g.284983 Transcript_127439/m.284983 type:complete len:360 (+) Transcript_127439:148-1227(+)